jgi:hypothetical protein
MHRRLARGAAAASSAVVLLAGCGSSSSGGSNGSGANPSSAPPKTELLSAIHALGAGSALTTSLGLDTTAANILHIDGEGGGGTLTPAQAGLIASGRIVIETVAPAGTSLNEAAAAPPSGLTVEVTGSAGGTTYFSLRDVNRTIYLQVDLRAILGAAGKASEYQSLVARTSSLPPFVRAFIAGRAVAAPISTLTTLESLLKGYAQGAGARLPNGAQLRSLTRDLKAAVLGDVTVTRTSTGATDKLAVAGNIRNLAIDVVATITRVIPAAASRLSPHDASRLPDQDLTLDASVTKGALSTLSFDAGQFSPHHQDTLPIVAAFTTAGAAIRAPAGATTVNFQDLISLFTAAASSSTSSGAASATPHPAHSPVPSK